MFQHMSCLFILPNDYAICPHIYTFLRSMIQVSSSNPTSFCIVCVYLLCFLYLNLALIADCKFGQWDRDRDTLILGPLKEL